MTHSAEKSPMKRWAVIVSSSVFAGPFALTTLVEWILKAVNPDNVDVSAGLAYLQPILITGWTLIALFILLAVILNIMVARSTGTSAKARLPWTVLFVQIMFIAIFAVSHLGTESLI